MNGNLIEYLGRPDTTRSAILPKAAFKHYALIREHAIGLYESLEDKLQETPNRTCIAPHCVSLHLEARRVPFDTHKRTNSCSHDSKDQLRFQLTIAHEPGSSDTEINTQSAEVDVEPMEHGDDMYTVRKRIPEEGLEQNEKRNKKTRRSAYFSSSDKDPLSKNDSLQLPTLKYYEPHEDSSYSRETSAPSLS
jgi:hypothetical protein